MCKGTLEKGNRRLIDCVWFDTRDGFIGIVVSLDTKTNVLRAEIGKGAGENESVDALNIMEYGAPFPCKAALQLFGDELNEKVEVKSCELYGCIAELLKECEHNLEHPSWKHFSRCSESSFELLSASS